MPIVWATFLARVSPVSTRANPACMNMTKNPVINVQKMLTAIFRLLTSWAIVASVTLSLSLVSAAVVLAPVYPAPVESGPVGATVGSGAAVAAAGAAGA